jgi:transposase
LGWGEAPLVFQDESGFSLLPAVRATWAPRGRTPVLTHRFSWTRMSMAGALAYRPDRSQAVFVFQIKKDAYNTDSLIDYLIELRKHLRGQPVTLIWDKLSAHRSADMTAWLATQRHWLRVEQLPGYAHDLNPMELVWGNVKARELANLCPEDIAEAPCSSRNRTAPCRTQLRAVLQLR